MSTPTSPAVPVPAQLPDCPTQPRDPPTQPSLPPAPMPPPHPSLPPLPSPPPLPAPSCLSRAMQEELETDSRPHKGGRRSRFSSNENLVIIREFGAAKAHIAPNGEKKERFKITAARVNGTTELKKVVKWKTIQDRYKRLQDRSDENDKIEIGVSGVGGEVGEMEGLLSAMREARADLSKAKDANKQKFADEEERKERLGTVIRQRATKCVTEPKRKPPQRGAEVLEDSDADEEDDPSPSGSAASSAEGSGRKSRRVREVAAMVIDDEVAEFTAALKKGDAQKYEIDTQRLQLERERFETKKEERKRDREERAKERDDSRKLELENFRIMMDVLRSDGPP